MSGCEKCWRDSHNEESGSQPDRYHELTEERRGNPCTAEQQAGEDASQCPSCKRMALHQFTGECMAGCKGGEDALEHITKLVEDVFGEPVPTDTDE